MATGNEIVTIGQAARYLGVSTSGSLDSRPITLRQLKSMVDGTKATSVKLPDGYTQVEYIESKGAQYINTGVKPDSGTTVDIDVHVLDTNAGTNHHICSASDSNYYYFLRLLTDKAGYGMRLGSLALTRVELSDVFARHHFVLTGNSLSIDGGDPVVVDSGEFSVTKALTLFCSNTNGTIGNKTKMRLYSCRMTNSTGAIADFCPARRESDGALGLYDTVRGQFFANSASGTVDFDSGPDVPPTSELDTRLVTISQLKRIYISPTIVSWADGTDEEVSAMVAAADAGKLNLSDYWTEGDARVVRLSEMTAGVSGLSDNTHAEQDVEFVLAAPGHYMLTSGKPCNFVALQKDCLIEPGDMKSSDSNTGGWDACPRRTWCNFVYYDAIPKSLIGIFKQFIVVTADGSSSTSKESKDWFSLFSEKEIFGSIRYADETAESKNSRLDYFKAQAKRIKHYGTDGNATHWWERSPTNGESYSYCHVLTDGGPDLWSTSQLIGIAPFGCI